MRKTQRTKILHHRQYSRDYAPIGKSCITTSRRIQPLGPAESADEMAALLPDYGDGARSKLYEALAEKVTPTQARRLVHVWVQALRYTSHGPESFDTKSP